MEAACWLMGRGEDVSLCSREQRQRAIGQKYGTLGILYYKNMFINETSLIFSKLHVAVA